MIGSERLSSEYAIWKTTAAGVFFFLFLTPTAEHPWVVCSLSVFQQVQELSLQMLAHPHLPLRHHPGMQISFFSKLTVKTLHGLNVFA